VTLRVTQAHVDDGEIPPEQGYEVGDLVIIDGEHRWRATSDLGYDEVGIAIMPEGFSFRQARIATLRHNRARGSEDLELTADLLRDLESLGALDWAQDSLSLDDVELNKLLTEVPVAEQLADSEFTEAWEPADGSAAQGEGIEGRSWSTSPQAVAAIRAAEAKAARAKTDEDRQTARQEAKVTRLTLTYTGEEAHLIKRVLYGAEGGPAQRILDLCAIEVEAGRA
jgi:ParB-like chromosome segregation protein Spo0J